MAGYRTWGEADRLTPDDLNNYLMGQTVPRFAATVDRDAQMGVPVDGQLSYVIAVGHHEKAVGGEWEPLVEPAEAITRGVATLAAGTVVVTTAAVTAVSRIHLTAQSLGTVTVPSALAVSARTAATSFTILASQATDTSVVAWSIVEP